MVSTRNRGISISTILMFLGGAAVLVASYFPILSNHDKTKINVINADTQLALAVSEYLTAKTQGEEKIKLQEADIQLQNRLTFDKAHPLFDVEEASTEPPKPKPTLSDKDGAKEIMFIALNEISDYYGFDLNDMKNSKTIAEFVKLIVNTTNMPNMLNYLKMYNFINSHSENFSKETQQQTSFKRWVLAGILILAVILIGASFLFTFRHTNVLFLAFSLLCLILILLMFYQTSMTHSKTLDLGNLYADGTLIFLGGGLFLFLSSISGINSKNWLVAIIVYLIVLALAAILFFFFKDSFSYLWFMYIKL
ncbi:MAG: hypothetical protein K8S87_11995 [Planctomycetes bacterium]|nr:hypothetical protein [Planctomycetota bacterium]